MGKYLKEGFKWVSEFLLAVAVGFLFLAISIAVKSEITGVEFTYCAWSFGAFALSSAASFVSRMVSV